MDKHPDPVLNGKLDLTETPLMTRQPILELFETALLEDMQQLASAICLKPTTPQAALAIYQS